MNNNKTTKRELSIVTWKEVRDDVIKVNKELGAIIDSISPNDNYKFIKATYLYGDIFIKNGEAQLPINNNLNPLSHHSIDKKIQKELAYSPMPLLFMLNKNNEIFFNTNKRIIPINLYHKGDLSGTYETMDYMMGRQPMPIWNLAAGSRSIFMLPKITDRFGLKKLQMRYDIPTTIQIKQLSDHWELFKNIAQNNNNMQNWQSTILFFNQKWFENSYDSKDWNKFKNYLLRTIWEQAYYSINKTKFNMCWETFAEIIYSRRLQPKPYLIDQAKHLLSIVAGNFPAFTVMDDTQESAPTASIQEAFLEHYALKQYLPILMHVCMPQDRIIKPNYVYYSLSLPTILDGSPLKKTASTVISDLREIKLLIETLKSRFKTSNYSETNWIIQNTQIDFFHYKKDLYNQIKGSENIPIEDASFLKAKNSFLTRGFCPTSPFFSGCIRIKALPKNNFNNITY